MPRQLPRFNSPSMPDFTSYPWQCSVDATPRLPPRFHSLLISCPMLPCAARRPTGGGAGSSAAGSVHNTQRTFAHDKAAPDRCLTSVQTVSVGDGLGRGDGAGRTTASHGSRCSLYIAPATSSRTPGYHCPLGTDRRPRKVCRQVLSTGHGLPLGGSQSVAPTHRSRTARHRVVAARPYLAARVSRRTRSETN